MDWKGKKDVLRNQDGGGFSEIYQAINTVIGMKYHLSYDVWATPLKNTAGKQCEYLSVPSIYGVVSTISFTQSLKLTACFLGCSLHGIQIVADCTTTDSNGLLAITEGAVKMGCEQNGFCGHGDELLCPAAPAADGKW